MSNDKKTDLKMRVRHNMLMNRLCRVPLMTFGIVESNIMLMR